MPGGRTADPGRATLARPSTIRQARTREGLRTAGKALRGSVPRKSHAAWEAAPRREDPVDILVRSSKGRIERLIPLRYGRMLQSPFAFYRGAAAVMAADLMHTPVTGVTVQVCGDCHLLNFGGFATPERRIIFDINDFDETLPGPWEWDVKRLAASLVIAGRHNQLKESRCRDAAAAAVRGYRERMTEFAARSALDVWYSFLEFKALAEMGSDPHRRKEYEANLRKAISKSSIEVMYPKLVDAADGPPRIKDDPPLIFHASTHRQRGWVEDIRRQIGAYRDSLSEDRRVLLDRYRLVDFAVKVVGVGSVGTACGVALLLATDDDPLFLQVKEARESVLEPYVAKSAYANRGQRVVIGQRIMQAASDVFLGWLSDEHQRHYYVRQLRDIKITPIVETLGASQLGEYATACGWALAAAHARSGQAGVLAGYMGKGDALDDAISEFASGYADQNERDHAALVKAVRTGRVKAITDE